MDSMCTFCRGNQVVATEFAEEYDRTHKMTADKPVSEVASDIEDEVVQRFTGEDVRAILLRAREEPASGDPLGAFQMSTGYEEPIYWPAPWVSWSLHFAFLVPRFRALTREAENTARDIAEIPRVGEGWVSEMTLLREVQAAYPEERVVHQARPGWLSPQSLDIYLPDYNVGIEYQGAQHTRPVEHFGGAEAFERQQDRDAMKRGICSEHSCALIEVHPGYQLAQVLSRVEDAMQKVGTRPPSLS